MPTVCNSSLFRKKKNRFFSFRFYSVLFSGKRYNKRINSHNQIRRLWLPEMNNAACPISTVQLSLYPLRFRSASNTSLPIDMKETINRNCVVGFDMWQIESYRTAHTHTQQSTWQKHTKKKPPAPDIQFVSRPYKIESVSNTDTQVGQRMLCIVYTRLRHCRLAPQINYKSIQQFVFMRRAFGSATFHITK